MAVWGGLTLVIVIPLRGYVVLAQKMVDNRFNFSVFQGKCLATEFADHVGTLVELFGVLICFSLVRQVDWWVAHVTQVIRSLNLMSAQSQGVPRFALQLDGFFNDCCHHAYSLKRPNFQPTKEEREYAW